MKDSKESSLSFKNIFKRETKLASYIIVCMTIVVISLSYALFFKVDKNSQNQETYAGDLKFTYANENSNGKITSEDKNKLICFQPMSYEEAELYRTECSYVFSVQNTGTLMASYSIGLKALEGNYEANKDKLRIIIRKKVENAYVNIYEDDVKSKSLSELMTATNTENGLLLDKEESIESDETLEEGQSEEISEEELVENEESLTSEEVIEPVDAEGLEETSPSTDNILILIENETLDKNQSLEYQIQIYLDETKYDEVDNNQKIAYQIVGTGLVHESQPISETSDESSGGGPSD